MAITTTVFRLDTCSCLLAYDWDTTSDPATRVHTNVRRLKPCPRHAAVADGGDEHAHPVLAECRRKNEAVAEITKLLPPERREDVAWRVAEDGTLTVTAPRDLPIPLSTRTRLGALQAALEIRG